ncbi:hypothetical protein MKEN_00469600 [Mycena kentingensis (nom. inval.)]|nr:hypothetical protein MKEN_00469600 [Mycena kentingensis (nom. inval.)]
MPFSDLPLDIIREVLVRCDIHAVLMVSRVSKGLRRLTRGKQLWLGLLADLDRRGILDLLPDEDLRTFSTYQLIRKVRSIVDGPRSWAPNARTPMRVKGEVHIPIEIPTAQSALPVRLLAGGRFMGFQTERSGAYELWDLFAAKMVWKSPEPEGDAPLIVNMVGDCGSATIVLASPAATGTSHVTVLRYAANTGEFTTLFDENLPVLVDRGYTHIPTSRHCVFCIQIAREFQVAIVDYVHGTWALLHRPRTRLQTLALVDGYPHENGYLVLATACDRFLHPDDLLTLEVHRLSNLEWVPVSCSSVLPESHNLLPAFSYTTYAPHSRALSLSVLPHPLHHDTYRLTLETGGAMQNHPTLPDYISTSCLGRRVASAFDAELICVPWTWTFDFAPKRGGLSPPRRSWLQKDFQAEVSWAGYSVLGGDVVDTWTRGVWYAQRRVETRGWARSESQTGQAPNEAIPVYALAPFSCAIFSAGPKGLRVEYFQ